MTSVDPQQFQDKPGVHMSLFFQDLPPDPLARLSVLVTWGKLDGKSVHDVMSCQARSWHPPPPAPLVVLLLHPPYFLFLSRFPSSFCSFQTSSGVPERISPSFDGGATREVRLRLRGLALEAGGVRQEQKGRGNQRAPLQRREELISWRILLPLRPDLRSNL